MFGPILHEVKSPSSLNTSVKDFYEAIVSGSKPESVIQTFSGSWIDVRDVAEAHIRALEIPEAGGKRFIITSGNFTWQDWCTSLSFMALFWLCYLFNWPLVDTINALGFQGTNVPIGTPGSGTHMKHPHIYDASRARDVLGMVFRSKEETAKDSIESFRARGW